MKAVLMNKLSGLGVPFRGQSWPVSFGIAALSGAAIWILYLTGALLCPVPFLALPLMLLAGYCARLARPILNGEDAPQMPAWQEWGKLFQDGLRVGSAILTVLVPLIVVAFGLGILPVVFVLIFDYTDIQLPPLPPLIGVILSRLLSLMIGGLVCGAGVLSPVAWMHVISQRSYLAFFRVREWASIWRANAAGFIVSFVLQACLGGALAWLFLVAPDLLDQTPAVSWGDPGVSRQLLEDILFAFLMILPVGAGFAYWSLVSSILAAMDYTRGKQQLLEMRCDRAQKEESYGNAPCTYR